MPRQLGIHSPQLAQLRALLTTKGRSEQARFLFEGPTLLEEAITAGLTIESVYATDTAWAHEATLRKIPDDQIFLVPAATLAKFSELTTPNGIVSIARRPHVDPAQLLSGSRAMALLAGLNDPGNVGTLIRSAEAFGLGGVILLEGGVDPYHPKVVRAAMGALFRLPLVRLTIEALTPLIFDRPLIALARGGSPLASFQFPPRALLVVGHERHGVPLDLPPAAATVEIPHEGPTESLNAAIAGSIMFYALSCK